MRAQVEALDTRVEIAAEEYNEAEARHRAADRRASGARRELEALRVRIGRLTGSLSRRAEHMYRSGPAEMMEVLLGSTDFLDLATTWDLLCEMSDDDAELIARLKRVRRRVREARVELERSEAQARRQRDIALGKKRTIQARLAERKRLLAGIESEIAALEERERAEAARRAAAARRRVARSSFLSAVVRAPRGSAHGGVVSIALSRLGCPYRWGAAGPNAFDCSGLTMWAYRQIGISLPHSSRGQYDCGERVSRAHLRPGDLVFFGGGRIHHVGIYIGGGDFVHAPHTGDVVKVSPLSGRGDYAGACRP